MIGDHNKSTSISPWWLVIPVLLVLVVVGLGVGSAFVYWRMRSAEPNRTQTDQPHDEVRPVAKATPSPTEGPIAIEIDGPPTPKPKPIEAGKTVSGGVLNGKAISLPKPVYPPVARAANASGAVTVQVVVDEEGNVTSATAVSGHALLRPSAVNAARSAKFSPTKLSGVPVKVSGVLIYNFTP